MTETAASQDEIDRAFRRLNEKRVEDHAAKKLLPYDFRRPDRIAKDQLRSIHLLHENFARSLASSLSAYLRAYVAATLVSVEQLSFLEFSQCLPSPTCMITLGMRPFDGSALLEINPSLVFPILEMLLGGSAKPSGLKMNRETTEIEQSILEAVYRIILQDLRESWRQVATVAFGIESHETDPSLLQFLAPNEAVVAISLEVRIGETSGMMNIGIPSIVIKMLRQKFDQGWSNRRSGVSETEQARALRLVRPANVQVDARLQGPTLSLESLLNLNVGDVLAFDTSVDKPVDFLINGKLKYQGQVVAASHKRAFHLMTSYHPLD